MQTERGVGWHRPVKGTAVDGLLTILAGAGVGTSREADGAYTAVGAKHHC